MIGFIIIVDRKWRRRREPISWDCWERYHGDWWVRSIIYISQCTDQGGRQTAV